MIFWLCDYRKKLGDFLIFFLISWVCPSGVNGAEVLVGICIMIFRYGKQQQVIDRHHQPGLAGVNSSWCCVFTSEVRGPRNFPLAFRILKRNGFFHNGSVAAPLCGGDSLNLLHFFVTGTSIGYGAWIYLSRYFLYIRQKKHMYCCTSPDMKIFWVFMLRLCQ